MPLWLIVFLVIVGICFLIGVGCFIYVMFFEDNIPEMPWHT